MLKTLEPPAVEQFQPSVPLNYCQQRSQGGSIQSIASPLQQQPSAPFQQAVQPSASPVELPPHFLASDHPPQQNYLQQTNFQQTNFQQTNLQHASQPPQTSFQVPQPV